jgi:hypothetical protein
MKKTLLLTLAAGLFSVSPLMAQVDLYITGSTAFRASVHDACALMFSSHTEYTGTPATGGDTKTGNSAAQWTMTGTPIAGLTALGDNTLTIHGLFTGSVQGIQTVEQGTKLEFLGADGVSIKTNTPTIAFSDASSASTPYPATGDFSEEQVCVQPFVMCKANSHGGLDSITNVTWEQLKYAIQAGRIPLSAWTGKPSDLTNYVYLIERTKDSGTRRTELAQELDGYNQSATVYIYDTTNNFFYKTNTGVAGPVGSFGTGVSVVGAAGNGGANLNWGSGYVGGGDIKTELGYTSVTNQAIAYLSIADAKGVTGINWSQVLPFNGGWPTVAGPNISGNTGTNDFSPITSGVYPCWGYEVLVYPNVDPSSIYADQNLTAAELGSQTQTGTILGVLDAQTVINGGSPIPGSIEDEIELSKPTGATGIRLSDMVSSRSSVGGTITP